ncbi:preprotein translocase subunit SecG [Flavobacterium aciduliphilum]|uniref:Protein-export membrane protein SecG n=2 Tax=Flavobacterium aciduliphilum TaxID=1101402 RepID=A0A328YC55_9FLAO|nr:preprotein translocase subunit SecG [Flavobacterium aciduliphilum]
MVQNPKGGGLSSSISGSQQLGGVQKTTDFLDKSTWVLGGTLIALVLLSSLSFTGSLNDNKKIIDSSQSEAKKTETAAPKTSSTPAAPASKTEKK